MTELFVKELCFCDECNAEAEYYQLTFKGWLNLCARHQSMHGDNETTERLIVVEPEVDSPSEDVLPLV